MHYLGGKTRLAKPLVARMRELIGDLPAWEPFCGGLSVSCELAQRERVLCTDAHAPLIALYRAMQRGWTPPETLTEEQYRAARALPDHDPLKAFAGFGCSYAGKWFGGFARDRQGSRDLTNEASRAIRKKLPNPRLAFECVSFFDVPLQAFPGFIYCDPPYANTTGYATGAWDANAFWQRASEWASRCPVFVSEFSAPAWARCVLELPRKKTTGFTREAAIDCLYLLR